MKNDIPNSSIDNIIAKSLVSVLLFGYFGFIIIPEWFIPLSQQFIFWVFALPVVLITLIVIGVRGGVGLWREKTQNIPPNPEHKFSVWLASLAILWFIISIAFANITHYSYGHKKFDSEIWKNAGWDDGDLFQLSLRERMFDDLITNILPGRTKVEMLDLLGEPDEQRDIEGEQSFIYYYGQGIMDPECLIITFDDKGFIKDFDTSVCG